MNRILVLIVALLGVTGYALAGSPAPEIDASSGVAAVALLSSGLLILHTRRRKR